MGVHCVCNMLIIRYLYITHQQATYRYTGKIKQMIPVRGYCKNLNKDEQPIVAVSNLGVNVSPEELSSWVSESTQQDDKTRTKIRADLFLK